MLKCPKCWRRSLREYDGKCTNLDCIEPRRTRIKPARHYDFNKSIDGKKAKKMCPLCIEVECWPSACHNGPNKASCDCHMLIGERAKWAMGYWKQLRSKQNAKWEVTHL